MDDIALPGVVRSGERLALSHFSLLRRLDDST
jgi:hypothetical protein